MYVTLPLPRSVLFCQNFHHTQLTYFASPRKQGGGKFIKVSQKGQVHVNRFGENVTKLSNTTKSNIKYFEHIEYFEKFGKKEVMPSVPHYASPTTTPTPSPTSSLT